jgi:hypothetical protein
MDVKAINPSAELSSLQETPPSSQIFQQIEQDLWNAETDLENGVKTGNYTAFHDDMLSIDSTLSGIDFSKLPQNLQSTANILQQTIDNLVSANYPLSSPNGLFLMLGQAMGYADAIARGLQ